MKVEADGYLIDFGDEIISAFTFDEKDSTKTTFHGVPMKDE